MKHIKKTVIWLFVGTLIVIGTYLFGERKAVAPIYEENNNDVAQQINQQTADTDKNNDVTGVEQLAVTVPLERAKERVTKKPFGIFITPKTSPVQPERFTGYHTGTDFEIFPEELDAEVAARAICDGTLLSKRMASGYGGVLVQSCQLAGEDVTVVYGHLALSSVNASVGSKITFGDNLGLLGAAKSKDTDSERKHLHLGIHRGKDINILGYVANKSDLSNWLDPCEFVCK